MMKISLHGTVGADLRNVRAGTTRWSPLAVLLAVIPASGVLINDSGGHENNASEAINVGFSGFGHDVAATGTAPFSDAVNRQVLLNIGRNELTSVTNGTIASSPAATDPAGDVATAPGTLTPKLSVDAANLNGAHSASLSNPIDGILTYLMTASDPAGAVTKVDAPTTGGYNDSHSNAPAGRPQFPNLLTVYAVRSPWRVAGVDYAVGIPTGTTLQDWQTISMSGVSISGNNLNVTGNNVALNGIDFRCMAARISSSMGPNDTIENSNLLYGAALASASDFTFVNAVSGSSNLTIKNCVVDGNGSALGSAARGQSTEISISSGFTGTVTLECDLFQNFAQHLIEFNANAALVDNYNVRAASN